MKRLLVIASLSIIFLFVGCSSNRINERLIALEQSVNDTNNKRGLEIEKINLTLGEIKKEQVNMRLIVEENDRRISQLESLIVSERPQKKQIEGSITFVKGSTAFISLGKNDGVTLGDIFEVYIDRESKEKIASIKITAVDLGSSSGEIEEEIQDINVGYFVKIVQ
jgi:ribosomal protein S4E